MTHVPEVMDAVTEQKQLAVEAEVVQTDDNDTNLPRHKSKLEKRLLFKQDISIVGLLAGCYWFAYLVRPLPNIKGRDRQRTNVYKDRGALGNARIMGLQTDLGLSAKEFYNCLMMFCKCTET